MTSPPGLLLGAARPRVELRPAAVDTLGAIAAELGERAGITLEPWQRDGLDMLLSTRADGRWACYEYAELCSRRNGKTATLLVRALAGFLLLDETPILWTAQEVKTSMRAWRDFRTMLWKLAGPAGRVNDHLVDLGEGVLVRINASNGKEGFERVDTGQELRMVARSKDSGRGFDADLLVVDEAYDFTADQQDALGPTQMARPNPQVAYASSPPLSGAGSDALYRLRERAEQALSERLGWRDWGRAELLDDVMAMPERDRAQLLDDLEVWLSANPAVGGGRVFVESIRNMRESMSEAGFCREVLGMWPRRQVTAGGAWKVIGEAPWRLRGGLGEERPDRESVAFGLEASWPDAMFGAIAVAGRRVTDGDGDGEVLTVQVVDHRPGTAWMVRRAKELDGRYPDAPWVVDEDGPAGHLVADLEGAGLYVVTPSMHDLARAHGRWMAEVVGDEPRLRHYDQRELDDALKAAGTRPLGKARTWAVQGDTDISPLTAATGALWGALERSAEPWAMWE